MEEGKWDWAAGEGEQGSIRSDLERSSGDGPFRVVTHSAEWAGPLCTPSMNHWAGSVFGKRCDFSIKRNSEEQLSEWP